MRQSTQIDVLGHFAAAKTGLTESRRCLSGSLRSVGLEGLAPGFVQKIKTATNLRLYWLVICPARDRRDTAVPVSPTVEVVEIVAQAGVCPIKMVAIREPVAVGANWTVRTHAAPAARLDGQPD